MKLLFRNAGRVKEEQGEDILQFVVKLAGCSPRVEFLQFARLAVAPPLEERAVLTDDDVPTVKEARQLREDLSLPFWSSAMLAASRSAVVPRGVLEAAIFHQSLEGRTERVASSEVTVSKLAAMEAAAVAAGELLALTSLVSDSERLHLPLLDFHCPHSSRGTALAREVIRLLGCEGVLVSSGKSYHFYGQSFMTDRIRKIFLGQALLFDPIVDRAWIAHQLMEDCCVLRISTRPDYGRRPTVLARVGAESVPKLES